MGAVVAGYFGKLPGRADFLSVGLPDDFVVPWDRMIRHMLLAPDGDVESGARLPTDSIGAPRCGFLLQRGLCGPSAWLGAVMPSRDGVGRSYPFMVGMSCAATQLSGFAWDALAVVDAYCALLADFSDMLAGGPARDMAWLEQRSTSIAQAAFAPGSDGGEYIHPLQIDLSTGSTSWWSVMTEGGRSLTRCAGLRMPTHIRAYI